MHSLSRGSLEAVQARAGNQGAPITCLVLNAPISAPFALAPTRCRVRELEPGLASRKRPPTAAATLATPCGDARIIDFARNMIAKTNVQTVQKRWVK
jgi:hypothetical protein